MIASLLNLTFCTYLIDEKMIPVSFIYANIFLLNCDNVEKSVRIISCAGITSNVSLLQDPNVFREGKLKVKYSRCNNKLVLHKDISLFFKGEFVLFLWDVFLLRIVSRGPFRLS